MIKWSHLVVTVATQRNVQHIVLAIQPTILIAQYHYQMALISILNHGPAHNVT